MASHPDVAMTITRDAGQFTIETTTTWVRERNAPARERLNRCHPIRGPAAASHRQPLAPREAVA